MKAFLGLCYSRLMSQKYVIAHFVDISTVDEEFPASEWPLHITLLANFTLAQPIGELIKDLILYAKSVRQFSVVTNGEARFGPHDNIAVSLIEPSKNIIAMHRDLSGMASKLGATYDEPKFMADGYRPHATIQAKARLFDSQTIMIDNFTLVDMFPRNDINRRKIIRTFSLSK